MATVDETVVGEFIHDASDSVQDDRWDAIYVRHSGSSAQRFASQEPELRQYVAAYCKGQVRWYYDAWTGKTMDRPWWNKLEAAYRSGKVKSIVVWRIDRLGRDARGLTALFAELVERKLNFVSIKDGIDLQTPGGRLIANVLASVAQYETEVRQERVSSGQAAAKAAGKSIGRKPGTHTRISITQQQVDLALRLRREGEKNATIAKAVGISLRAIYDLLRRERRNGVKV